MKRVTASDARKNWFRLLDEAAAGEKIVIERGGRRIVLSREELEEKEERMEIPDYSELIQVPHAEEADCWSWDWSEDGVELVEKPRP
jgi:hypothetical protein